jgi:hypothetical protein
VSVSLEAVSAISDMFAPVVLITTGGILSSGLLSVYGVVGERMRVLTREHLDIRTGPHGELLDTADVSAVGRERLVEIEQQLPMMLRRGDLVRDAVFLIYVGIVGLVLSMFAITVAVTHDSEAWGWVALGLVLAGTVVMLAGIVVAGRSLVRSADSIRYAVERTRGLPANRPD